jgi:hypothetical protein
LTDLLTIRTESIESWNEAVNDVKGSNICGLRIDTSGPDLLSCEIRLAYLGLPDGRVYIADINDLGKKILEDLATLVEDDQIKKVIHDAKPVLATCKHHKSEG